MKKNLFCYLFVVICSVSLFTSCSDDDEKVVCPVEATTFTDANGLELTYSGVSMLGKKIVFTPDVTDGTKATLILSGDDLNLAGLLSSDNTKPISAPGVFPGEETTTIAVEGMIINGNKVTFEGTNEKDGRTIKYNGEVTSGSLKLDLKVTMPTNALANTSWNLAPVGDMFSPDPTSPIYLKWDADPFPFNGGTWEIQSFFTLTLAFPVINNMTVPQMLSGILNKITFLPDGNIQASYKDQLTDTQWKTSELNIAMYSVKGDKLYLYLNPSQIMASTNKGRAGVDELLPSLMNLIMPMLTNGIPLSYSTDAEGQMTVYLDTATLLPILKIVAPLFEDEAVVDSIAELLKAQAGDLAAMVDGFMKPVLLAMPQIVSTTKTVEIGIKVVPTAK